MEPYLLKYFWICLEMFFLKCQQFHAKLMTVSPVHVDVMVQAVITSSFIFAGFTEQFGDKSILQKYLANKRFLFQVFQFFNRVTLLMLAHPTLLIFQLSYILITLICNYPLLMNVLLYSSFLLASNLHWGPFNSFILCFLCLYSAVLL